MNDVKLALTGFMGVGKSSVARHLAHITKHRRVDLDHVIEKSEGRSIVRIIDEDGIDRYREIESHHLAGVIADRDATILSLGGGAWTVEQNRDLIRSSGYTSIWLEASFEHCWLNISFSKKERPLARDKEATRRLFDERQKVYCLADWHFVIRPDHTSFEVAKQIAEEIGL